MAAMIIRPKIRGFVCVTAHPAGCAAHVKEQMNYIRSKGKIANGCKRALIIGSSTGYGLSSRIAAVAGCDAATLGLFYEREPIEGRLATTGWYNSIAVAQQAQEVGLYAKNINGDAFSDEIKEQTIRTIKEDLGTVDLVIYSLASPRRQHPKTGEVSKSVLKPLSESYTAKTVDTDREMVHDITIEPATEQEVAETINVMGGEDWVMWMDALADAGALAPEALSVAYSYIGPELTFPIYRNGTIGLAKEDLEKKAHQIDEKLAVTGGGAYVSINKALVTQASSAIPVVPLYISILYKVMKEKGTHEGCIEQLQRLFAERLYTGGAVPVDDGRRIRIDDWEMRQETQDAVAALWPQINTENLSEISDFRGYQKEFLKLFGFGLPGVDYEAETEV